MSRLPFEVSVAQPCHQQWTAMPGAPAERHCESCNKTVHNLAALTHKQIERLVYESNGHLCARITHREDGSIFTARSAVLHPQLAIIALSATLATASPTAKAQQGQSAASQQSTEKMLVNEQKATTGLSGAVTDSRGALVVGASVQLVAGDKTISSTVSNEAGEFKFAVLPGAYELTVAAPGFAASSETLVVTTGGATAINISLTPGIHVSVQVTARPLDTFTTMGTLAISYGHWYRRVGYRFRHPVAYGKYILRRR